MSEQKSKNENVDQFKKHLAKTIADTFACWKSRDSSITQTTFAKFIGCSQPRVSNIIQGNIDQFTIDKLINFCVKLGINPIITAKPAKNLKEDVKQKLNSINESLKKQNVA